MRKRKTIVLMLVLMMVINIISPLSSLASELPNKLYVFDMVKFFETLPNTKVQYDYLSFATALQGLVSKEKPQIYFMITKETKFFEKSKDLNVDQFWLDELSKTGKYLADYEKIEVPATKDGFFSIINLFKASYTNGIVLWDENVPATSNVASTIAGVENLLPVRYDMTEERSLYKDLFINAGSIYTQTDIKKNLVGMFTGTGNIPDSTTVSTGSKKNDAYIWAKEQYLDKGLTNPSLLASSLDAFSWRVPFKSKLGDDMYFTKISIPKTMRPGESVDASVTVKNTGTTTWTRDSFYRLINYDFTFTECKFKFSDGEFGSEPSRVLIDSNAAVKPGDEYTFNFKIKAPLDTGTHELALRMVHDGVGYFFGDCELSRKITVAGEPVIEKANDAKIISVKYPKVIGKDQTGNVEVTIKNTGTSTWTKDKGYRLFNMAEAFSDWSGTDVLWTSRVCLSESDSIKPGETKTFAFNFKIKPGQPYSLNFKMEHTNVEFFGTEFPISGELSDTDVSNIEYVTATSAALNLDDVQVMSVKYPKVLGKDQTGTLEVTVKNVGSATWTKAGGYRLYNSAENCSDWYGTDVLYTSRVWLSESDSIKTGETKTFVFNFKIKPGQPYSLNFIMEHAYVAFFGSGFPITGQLSDTDVSNIEYITATTPSLKAYDAVVESIKYPRELGKNQVGNIEVTVRNTGSQTWNKLPGDSTPIAAFRLYNIKETLTTIQSGEGGLLWGRANLIEGDSIATGQTKTFKCTFTVNAGAPYSIGFKMENPPGVTFGSSLEVTGQLSDANVTNFEYITMTPNGFAREYYNETLSFMPFQYPDPQASITTIADYLIAKKAFFWDLSSDGSIAPIDDKTQTIGTDKKTLEAILESQVNQAQKAGTIPTNIGHVPWRVKYTDLVDQDSLMNPNQIEVAFADILAKYHIQTDNQVIDRMSLSNWSVLSKEAPIVYNQETINKKGANSNIVYDPGTKYITFYMGDYDSTSWLSSVLPVFWQDPKRGELPLGWAPTPSLVGAAPHIFNYMYENMTPNDYFIAGNSGGIDISTQTISSSLQNLLTKMKADYDTTDIDISGAVIGNIFSPEMQKAYSQLSPVGVACNSTDLKIIYDGTPFAYLSYLGLLSTDSEKYANDLWTNIRGGSQFYNIRTILCSPTVIVDGVRRLKELHPNQKIEVVDPYTFFRLFKESNGGAAGIASVTYTGEYAEAPVKIDGVVNTEEWGNAAEMVVSTSSEVVKDYGYIWGPMGGDDDLKSIFKIKWDKDNLYVLEERQDNVLNLSETGATPTYVVDSSLLMLDLSHTKSGAAFTRNAYSIYYTPKGSDGTPRIFLRGDGHPAGSDIKLNNTQISSTIRANGYTVELAIPWSEFYYERFIPQNDRLIGFSPLAIDNDGAAGFKGQIMWVGNGDDKANWADMKFVGAPLSVATTVEVSVNPSTIEVPEVGTTTTAAAIAVVKDQFGDVMTDQTVVYSIPETEGVAIDPSTGVITVSATLSAGTVIVTATCEGKTGTATLTLTPNTALLNGIITVMPALQGNAAVSSVGKDFIDVAYRQAKQDENGITTIVVDVNKIEEASEYIVWLPADILMSANNKKLININTSIGSVTIPENMFIGKNYQASEMIGILIGTADVSGLDQKLIDKISDRPIIKLNALVDGKVVKWENSKAPVTVSIDYIPTAGEVKTPDHVVVWYVNGKGEVNVVKNGRYDAATGKVTFTLSNF